MVKDYKKEIKSEPRRVSKKEPPMPIAPLSKFEEFKLWSRPIT